MLILGGSLGGIIGGKGYLPSDEGSNLLFWFQAEGYTWLSAVTGWNDLSATALVATAAGANAPAYSATSFNGRPGITFTTDDVLVTAATPLPTFKTVFVVGIFNTGNSGLVYEHGILSFTNQGSYLINPASSANGSWNAHDGVGSHRSNSNTGGTVFGTQNLAFSYGATGGVVTAGGVPLSPAPTVFGTQRANNVITDTLAIGARRNATVPFDGVIAAIYAINRAATAQDLTNFLNYAATR